MSSPYNTINNEILYNEISNEIPVNPLALDLPIQPDFSFLKESFQATIIPAYQVIQRMECWHILRNFNEATFMFTQNRRVLTIMDAVNNSYSEHSGASLGSTMRHLEYIAKHGFSEYRRYMLDPAEE